MKNSIIKISLLFMLIIVVSCSKDDNIVVVEPIPQPTVSSLNPTSGPKNATVTINGNHFGTDASKVRVFFNDVEATVTQVRNTKIGTTVPAGAFSGSVKVVVDGLELIGPEFNYIISENLVSTLAGSTEGNQDGVGPDAKFNRPTGIAVDGQGNVFVADPINNRIGKITPDGVVTTLAGGSKGSQDGRGSEAKFDGPWDVDVDSQGNLYVADANNHRIRKITPDGVVSTLAGSTQGLEDGTGEEAQFNRPRGIAVTSEGVVYVADTENSRVRVIDAEARVTTAPVVFIAITGIAVDREDSIYVVSSNYHYVWKLNLDTNETNFVAGNNGEGDINGNVESSKFRYPKDVALDAQGNIYVADESNHKIKKVSIENSEVSTYAGSTGGFADGLSTEAQFSYPYAIAVDGKGNIYVADTSNHKIRKIIQE